MITLGLRILSEAITITILSSNCSISTLVPLLVQATRTPKGMTLYMKVPVNEHKGKIR